MAEQEELDLAGMSAAFESARGASVVEAPVMEDTTTEAPVPSVATEIAPVIETSTKQVDTINYADWLAEKTEGFIKDEETLKTILPKAKGYDDLETKLKALEANVPQFVNEETKALYEAWANGDKQAVINYINESTKDYTTMSDIDVVRESLAKQHPQWSKKDIEIELRAEYGKQLELIDISTIDKDDSPDEYREAIRHNELVEENSLRLQRAARDSRILLSENQKKIELPKPAKAESTTAAPQRNTEQEAQIMQKWINDVETEVSNLPPIKYAIDDKEVEYSYTPEQQKEFTEKMKNFHIGNFAKERGWLNEDGTTNAKALSEDVRWLLDRDKIVKSVVTQVDTQSTKNALKKIKNIPDTVSGTTEINAEPGSLAEAMAAARTKAGW